MNKANLLRNMTYIAVFISIYMGSNSIANNNIHKGLREFLSIGVIPASLIATFRHIFLSGSIIKGGRFFEFECGGANLGIAIASIIAFLYDMSNQTLGVIFLIYAIYLAMGSIAWLIYKPMKNTVIWIVKFWSMTAALSYFSYTAFAHA